MQLRASLFLTADEVADSQLFDVLIVHSQGGDSAIESSCTRALRLLFPSRVAPRQPRVRWVTAASGPVAMWNAAYSEFSSKNHPPQYYDTAFVIQPGVIFPLPAAWRQLTALLTEANSVEFYHTPAMLPSARRSLPVAMAVPLAADRRVQLVAPLQGVRQWFSALDPIMTDNPLATTLAQAWLDTAAIDHSRTSRLASPSATVVAAARLSSVVEGCVGFNSHIAAAAFSSEHLIDPQQREAPSTWLSRRLANYNVDAAVALRAFVYQYSA
jgi:hypothetical protein